MSVGVVSARTALVLALLCLQAQPSYADIAGNHSEPLPDDSELERTHAVIGRVYIDNQNIFDLKNPAEDTRLFRLADRFHMRSRSSLIDNQLLFHSGDAYSRRLLDESARLLRSDRYLYDASVEPLSYHDGVVDVLVTTHDVWTLNPGVSFGRKGGKNSTGAELEELNLLGQGVSLSASHKSGLDRDETYLQVGDKHLFGGWTAASARFSDNSDGQARELAIGRPFYALDSRSSWGLNVLDNKRVDSLYDRGNIVDQYGLHRRYWEASRGLSHGLSDSGWAKRWSLGATYDDRQFEIAPEWSGASVLPPDRKLVYPWIQYELVQDDYLTLKNHDQIGRTEDFSLGTALTARLGWADRALGSDRGAVMFSASTQRGLGLSDRSQVLFNAGLDGRVEGRSLQNAVLDSTIRYYVKQSDHRLFFTTFALSSGTRLDLDNPIMLGGDNGLRGYPLRYQSGTSRALLTVEQRYFTDWYPFQLFRVGGAAFFDVGRIWGQGPLDQTNLGTLKDLGLGLRFGNSRSGLGNIIHVDVAFPLDGESSLKSMQFLVETRERF
jgi:outer membrane protein assembly factor BamA